MITITTLPPIPTPGSEEAKERGCRCPILDNVRGQGRTTRDGDVLYWVTSDCPLHGDLRAQLAAAHEAIGAALALLRQEQVSAAMLVLDDALKGRTR